MTNITTFPHRFWDIGQQRCVHSYAVHTDSVWALAGTSTFSHVYSGGRDSSVSAVFNYYRLWIDVMSPFSAWLVKLIYWFLIHLFVQLYLTDLQTRESVLLCNGEYPILQLALHDDSIWVGSTDSSVHRWPAEVCNPQKIFQRGNSFSAGSLSFSRARVSLEGSTPVCYIQFLKVQPTNYF